MSAVSLGSHREVPPSGTHLKVRRIRRCPLRKIIAKIWQVIQRILRFFFYRTKRKLNNEEIKWIQNIKKQCIPLPIGDRRRKRVSRLLTPRARRKFDEKELESKHFDKALDKIPEFARNTATNFIDIIFDEKLKPFLDKTKENPEKASTHLKEIFKTIMDFIDQISKPLIKLIDNGGTKEPILNEIVKNLQSQYDEQYLFKVLIERLMENVKKKIEQTQIVVPQEIDYVDYICKVVKWFLNKKDEINLIEYIGIDCNKYLLKTIYDETRSVLIDLKIDGLFTKLSEFLQDNKVEPIIHDFLHFNLDFITKKLSERAAETIQKMEWKKTFDEVIEVENEYAISYSRSERKLKNIKERKDFKEKTAGIDSKELDEKLILQIFSDQKFCRKEISQMIKQKVPLELSVYYEIANRVFLLLFPQNIPNTTKISQDQNDGIAEILNNLETPEGIKEILEIAEELLKEIFHPFIFKMIGDLKDNPDHFKYMFLKIAPIAAKYIIMLIVKYTFELISDPKKLEDLLAKYIMPAIIDKVMEGMEYQIIWNHIPKLAPYFYEMHQKVNEIQKNEENRDELIEEYRNMKEGISLKLYELTKPECHSFKFSNQESDEGYPMNYSRFRGIVYPVIKNIRKFLQAYKEKFGPLEQRKVEDQITEYLKSIIVDDKKVYNDFLMHIAYDIGEIGSNTEKKFLGFLPSISKLFLGAIYYARESHDFLFLTLMRALSKSITKERLQKMLFEEKTEAQHVDSDKLIKQRIDEISTLTYDYIRAFLKGPKATETSLKTIGNQIVSGVGKKILSAKFGNNAKNLNKAITKLYKKLLQNRKLLLNNFLNVSDVVLTALEKNVTSATSAETLVPSPLFSQDL